MHGMMSCACLAVALLCFALRRYEFLVLNDFKLFSCPAEAAVKRCTARPRRRTTGCQFTPVGPLEMTTTPRPSSGTLNVGPAGE